MRSTQKIVTIKAGCVFTLRIPDITDYEGSKRQATSAFRFRNRFYGLRIIYLRK